MSRSETRQACSDRYNLRGARVPRTQLAGSGARMAVHSPHSLAHCSSGSGRLRPTAELARFDSVKSGSGGATGIFIAPSWSLNGHSIYVALLRDLTSAAFSSINKLQTRAF